MRVSEHYLRKCVYYYKVITQCRCPAKAKTVQWSVCTDCNKVDRSCNAKPHGPGDSES